MTTVPVFYDHNLAVRRQRAQVLQTYPLGTLVGGTKKDVVISNQTATRPLPPRVCIYGWHRLDGSPIQPLSTVHENTYADYSHGIRLKLRRINPSHNRLTSPERAQHQLHSGSKRGRVLWFVVKFFLQAILHPIEGASTHYSFAGTLGAGILRMLAILAVEPKYRRPSGLLQLQPAIEVSRWLRG